MPKLDTTLHLDMYMAGKRKRSFPYRILKAMRVLLDTGGIYGLEWGDPEESIPLRYIKDHFLLPYISPEKTLLEIGVGGGRWTRYMLKAKQIYAVDYHQELLDELKFNFDSKNITYIKNNGYDFPNIPDDSIDFLFSFDTFVHLDIEIIDKYLGNIMPLLKPDSNVVIHYSDKTKPIAQRNKGFSENNPDTMRELVLSHNYSIFEEDVKTMWHSALVRFGLPPAAAN